MKPHTKTSTRIGSRPEVLNPQCSCTECDSVCCFTKRRADVPCACDVCTSYKSCRLYRKDSKSSSINLDKSGSIKVKNRETELSTENITKEIENKTYYKYDKNNEQIITKKHSRIYYKTADGNKQSEQKHSINVEYTRKDVSPSTAKLTAQVMDVPYKDFKKSLAFTKSNVQLSVPKLSPFDIFNRIKEAYKACSCKVCECIVGKSMCNCKPCECSECATTMKNLENLTDSDNKAPAEDEGCPCIRSGRDPCKCDCLGTLKCRFKYNDNNTQQACNCLPCQCIECKLKSLHQQRPIVVAQARNDNPQLNVCQCSPCECANCGISGYGMTANLYHEISTSVNRHPQCPCETCANEACISDDSQSCSCERQSRVMSKPFQRDSDDYDIRSAIVSYNDKSKQNNNDTTAMFAAINNTYPKVEANKKQCQCNSCECLSCIYKTKVAQVSDFSKMFKPIQNNRAQCKCLPCECQFCDKNNTENRSDSCACGECDCLNCGGKIGSNVQIHEIMKPISKYSAKGDFSCNHCLCADCDKLMTTCIDDICQSLNCKCEDGILDTILDDVIYPVKVGERLTPSMLRNIRKDSFIELCLDTLEANEEVLKQPLLKSPIKIPSAFSSVQKCKIQDDFDNGLHQMSSFQNESHLPLFCHDIGSRIETVKHVQVSKCRNGITSILHVENENMEQAFDPNISDNSSMSYLKDSGSITPTSKNRYSPRKSCCNSSGYDYPSYLIHFPKTNAETYLNDLLRFDYDKSINLNTMTLSSKNKHQNISNTAINKNFSLSEKNSEKSEMDEGYMDFQYSAQNFECNPYRPVSFEEVRRPYLSQKPTSSLREGFHIKHEKLSSKRNNNFDNFILDEDYERVQNTLKDAREFSQKLVKLLEKYEKADTEFESVSEKVKKSNEYILNNNMMYKNTEKNLEDPQMAMDDVPTKENIISRVSFESSTEELVKIDRNVAKRKDVELPNESGYSVGDDSNFPDSKASYLKTNNHECDTCEESIKNNDELLKSITEEKDPVNTSAKQDKKNRAVKKLNRNHCRMYRRSIVCSKRLKIFPLKIDTMETERRNQLTINEIMEDRDVTENITQIYDKAGIKDFSKKQDNTSKLVINYTTELRVSETENQNKDQKDKDQILQKDMVMIKQPTTAEHSKEIVELKPNERSSVLNKNIYLDTIAINGCDSITLLEKNVKATVRSIDKQTTESANENTTFLWKNKALVKLHSEVKKLLDMPVLNNFVNCSNNLNQGEQEYSIDLSKAVASQTYQEDDHNLQKTANLAATSSRKIYDAMKVTFLNVRRVSDHTVLVKWHVPRLLDNVEGYELLVDGRAVQKILGPSRRMAVLTCMPHSDKVLLTVRTVVAPYLTEHSPAATCIYHPKGRYLDYSAKKT